MGLQRIQLTQGQCCPWIPPAGLFFVAFYRPGPPRSSFRDPTSPVYWGPYPQYPLVLVEGVVALVLGPCILFRHFDLLGCGWTQLRLAWVAAWPFCPAGFCPWRLCLPGAFPFERVLVSHCRSLVHGESHRSFHGGSHRFFRSGICTSKPWDCRAEDLCPKQNREYQYRPFYALGWSSLAWRQAAGWD